MDSFYGGRAGFSFVIVVNFPSVAEMVDCFSQGPDYTAVHFDEHVLINTKNKNDPDNGKIFRRGYDFTNSIGGAVYIGTIVGPTGPAPMLELTTVEEVKSKQEEEGYEYRYSEGSYNTINSLVPGKDGDTFNDEIIWACCCVRDEDGVQSTAWIGFIFPYLVIDYLADSVSPYYHRSNDTADFVNEDLIDRTDDATHPYWEEWHISVPKGIKGESYNNFRVIVADDSIQDYDDKEDDVKNNRQVLVCDYYNYDRDESGEPVTIYLGPFNMVTSITVAEDGTITITYTHDDPVELDVKVKWVDEITLDEDGTLTVIYNDGSKNVFEKAIKWIDDVYIETADESGEEGTGDQKVHVVYDTGEEAIIGEPLNYIIEMSMVDSDYHLLVWYSDPAKRQEIIDSGQSYPHNGKDGWFDLGAVKDESGILIGLNISINDVEEIDTIAGAIAYLNEMYPEGLQGVDLHGKVVTIGDDEGTKRFYAFNYNFDEDGNYIGWYYVGEFNIDFSSLYMFAGEDDLDLVTKQSQLDVKGIWFFLEGED